MKVELDLDNNPHARNRLREIHQTQSLSPFKEFIVTTYANGTMTCVYIHIYTYVLHTPGFEKMGTLPNLFIVQMLNMCPTLESLAYFHEPYVSDENTMMFINSSQTMLQSLSIPMLLP